MIKRERESERDRDGETRIVRRKEKHLEMDDEGKEITTGGEACAREQGGEGGD